MGGFSLLGLSDTRSHFCDGNITGRMTRRTEFNAP